METKQFGFLLRASNKIGGLSWGSYVWLCVASGLVGIVTAGLVWLFNWGFIALRQFLFDDLGLSMLPYAHWTIALIPAAGGLVVAWVLHTYSSPEKLTGIPHIIHGVVSREGRLNNRNGLVHVIAAMLGIGFGAPVGADTPSAMIGAHLADFVGVRLNQKQVFMRALILAGIAAGIASTFDAQIAAVFFVFEVILGGFGGILYVVPVAIGAGMSALFNLSIGNVPTVYVFQTTYTPNFWVPILYVLLAVITAATAIIYIRLLQGLKNLWQRLALPYWAKPALAGLLVGLVGIWIPGIYGSGISQMQQAFSGAKVAVSALLLFELAKLILTPTALGAGFTGGVIGPALAIGSAFGLAYGELVAFLFPALGVTPVAFAMVAAASMLAASFHAPLFGAMLVLEMASNYAFIAPVFISVAISYAIGQFFLKGSAYTLALYGLGIELQPGIYSIVSRTKQEDG